MTNEEPRGDPVWTLPNAISALRIFGSPLLLVAAYYGRSSLFLWVVIILLLSDWLDGKLAGVLNQRTALGARLDSAVDALMYGSIAVAFLWMEEELVLSHLGWFLMVLASWSLSVVVALLRFRKFPSYHMWSAKIAWFVSACTVVVLLLTEITAILPWALALVTFSNLHAVAITLTLPHWATDIWSLRQAWRIRQSERV